MDKEVPPEKIDDFLTLFGNDVNVAINEIRRYQQANEPIVLPSQTRQILTGQIIASVNDVVKEYKRGRTKVRALDGVSLDIHEGEFVAITGSSGSGKSTLLHLMGGLEKPTSGRVIVNNINLGAISDRQLSHFRNKDIGFIFQFFYLQPFLNLMTNIELPGMFARTGRTQRQARSRMLAQAVGLNDRLKHLPKELSGGQIQRAAIARAMLNNPRLILADEPTGNLDSKHGAEIIKLFEYIRQQFGATVIVATHDQAVAAHATRVVTLQDGKQV